MATDRNELIRTNVLSDIYNERMRQEKLKAEGRFSATCADNLTDVERYVILSREAGEVARALRITCDRRPELLKLDRVALRVELIQVAAVAMCWAEGLDREGTK